LDGGPLFLHIRACGRAFEVTLLPSSPTFSWDSSEEHSLFEIHAEPPSLGGTRFPPFFFLFPPLCPSDLSVKFFPWLCGFPAFFFEETEYLFFSARPKRIPFFSPLLLCTGVFPEQNGQPTSSWSSTPGTECGRPPPLFAEKFPILRHYFWVSFLVDWEDPPLSAVPGAMVAHRWAFLDSGDFSSATLFFSGIHRLRYGSLRAPFFFLDPHRVAVPPGFANRVHVPFLLDMAHDFRGQGLLSLSPPFCECSFPSVLS